MWLVGSTCYQSLRYDMNKTTILIYSSIMYTIIVGIYAYHNIDECKQDIPNLTIENIILLLIMTIITFANNIAYIMII